MKKKQNKADSKIAEQMIVSCYQVGKESNIVNTMTDLEQLLKINNSVYSGIHVGQSLIFRKVSCRLLAVYLLFFL
jgi:hypothetical protein